MKINYIYKETDAEKKIHNKEFKNQITLLISQTEKEEKIKFGIINLVFCNDEFIREYNRNYLGHDYETDIITFYDKDGNNKTDGELLISVETVKNNSIRFKSGYKMELCRVIIHGILHLCGYQDKTAKERALMRKKENYYLKLI